MYSYDEVIKASLEYFDDDELAANVFVDKYALRDNDEIFLEKTPDDMHRRLSKEFARIEKGKFKKPLSEDEIYGFLKYYETIIPQGSVMYGCGNNYSITSLSNCFVVGRYLGDSYNGILHTDQELVNIAKRRGGNGIDISSLRPKDFSVQNAAKTTSGAISFIHRFSHTIREVGQSGRRGAGLITISVHHPDIEDFIAIKNDNTSATGVNISIRLSDEFLQAVENNTEYEQRWPVDSKNPQIIKIIPAKYIWNKIIHAAWMYAEPGLMFWDNIIKESPADCYADKGFKTVSANACSELPLAFHDACRLLAINLMSCVQYKFTKKAKFNFEKLYETTIIAQRLLDNIVDLELEKIQEIIKKIERDSEPDHVKYNELLLWQEIYIKCKTGRRTGCGFTALGDTLASLNIKYGSDTSIELAEKIEKTIKIGCYRSSVDMAKELEPFEYYDKNCELKNPFIQRLKTNDSKLYKDMIKYGRRNIACLTVAPTGTISTQASFVVNNQRYFGTTSGIEPCFMTQYTRRKKINPSDKTIKADFIDKSGDKWKEFTVYHPGLKAWLSMNDDITLSPYYQSCAQNINWINRIKLQQAIQKHNDHAISSTINLPNDVKEEEVAKIYNAAWKHNLKGITVYRDGCRTGVLISNNKEERPRELPCDIHHITVKGQQYFVLVGLQNNKPYEVFAGKNGFLPKRVKTGTIIRKKKNFYKAVFDDADEELSPITMATDEMEEVITRLTSGLLRTGADMHFIVKQLEKVGERQTDMNSFARSVARALKKYIPDGTKEGSVCEECGADSLIREEGCVICKSCGVSKCL